MEFSVHPCVRSLVFFFLGFGAVFRRLRALESASKIIRKYDNFPHLGCCDFCSPKITDWIHWSPVGSAGRLHVCRSGFLVFFFFYVLNFWCWFFWLRFHPFALLFFLYFVSVLRPKSMRASQFARRDWKKPSSHRWSYCRQALMLLYWFLRMGTYH